MPKQIMHRYADLRDAIDAAKQYYANDEIRILESPSSMTPDCPFVLEDRDSNTMIRSWERELYVGLGRRAKAPRGY